MFWFFFFTVNSVNFDLCGSTLSFGKADALLSIA